MNNDKFIPDVSYDSEEISPQDFISAIQSNINAESSKSVVLDETGGMQSSTGLGDYIDDDTPIYPDYIKRNVDNPSRIEGTTPVQQPVTTPQTNVPAEISGDVYQVAFDFLRDTGLLEVPDDMEEFDEEALQWLVQANRDKMYNEVLDDIISKSQDPHLAELYVMVHDGGTLNDVQRLFEVKKSEVNLTTYNTQDPRHQEALIKMYLSEGLDITIPAHKKRLDNLDYEVQVYMDKGEGEITAKEALKYFSDKQKELKRQIAKEIDDRKTREALELKQKYEREQQWIKDFKDKLAVRRWSNEKKENIIQQFNTVKLTDESEKLLWQYKMDKIWEDPALTHHLMDFLAKLDPYTLEFKEENETLENKVEKTIGRIIRNNKSNSQTNAAAGYRGQQAQYNKQIDPNNY